MIKRIVLVCLTVMTIGAAMAAVAGPTWVLLGERTVTDRLDHDTIVVTAERGEFSAVKIMIKKHAVDFRRVVVHYGNGENQDVEVRHTIPAGASSRTVDLAGGRRVIKSIDFWYDAHTLGGKKAVVSVLGLR